MDQAEWTGKGLCCVDEADVLTEAVKPSPPSLTQNDGSGHHGCEGWGWWLAVGCWLIIVGSGERAVLMEWQMLRVAWFIAISVLVSVLFTSSSPLFENWRFLLRNSWTISRSNGGTSMDYVELVQIFS